MQFQSFQAPTFSWYQVNNRQGSGTLLTCGVLLFFKNPKPLPAMQGVGTPLLIIRLMELVGSLNFHHSFTWERKTQDMCIVFILPNNYHVGVHPNTSIIQVPPTIANLDLSTKKVFLSFFLSFFLFCFPPTTQSKEECVYPSISPLFFFFEIFFYLLKRFNGLDFVDDLTVMICAF